MAKNSSTYQQSYTVSIPRDKLLEIAKEEILTELDYKVFLILLTQLDGFKLPDIGKPYYRKTQDPLNFKIIDIEQIADTLGVKKKNVKNSIKTLYDLYLLEKGSNDTVKDGYRFTF